MRINYITRIIKELSMDSQQDSEKRSGDQALKKAENGQSARQ
jgi:hypothetical protein